ncbi:MAG: inositol monophosphatase [Alphaproteobacteria bacterium]
MSKTSLDQRLQVATRAARLGAAQALPRFDARHELTVVSKGAQDRVTEVDRQVEETLRRAIRERFPEDAILGEEEGLSTASDGAETLWVIDPIDGTDCFVFGLPMWSISIAFMEAGEVVLGVVYDPVHDELFAAARDGGATLNGRPIRVSEATDLGAGLVGIGHSSRVSPEPTLAALDRLLAKGGLFHRCGSGALSLAWVAAGRLLGYHEAHINSWDCLAGLLLVREAGGWHSDFLAGDGLMAGNPLTAACHGLIDEMRALAGDG